MVGFRHFSGVSFGRKYKILTAREGWDGGEGGF